MPSSAAADEERIARLLDPGSPWRPRCVARSSSTNAELANAARAGEPAGAVLIADYQDAGRGRFERAWVAPPGTNLAISALLRPTRPTFDWGWLSLLVGLAVADGIRRLGGGARVTLKWPNDVLLDGRKLCGILSEMVVTDQGPAAVCGWGVNVSMDAAELPVPHATSLALAGLPTDKSALVAAMLNRLADLEARWDRGEDLRPDYLAGCSTIGREVRVHLDEQSPQGPSVTGRAVGVGPGGELLVDLGDGAATPFAAGDVVHLR